LFFNVHNKAFIEFCVGLRRSVFLIHFQIIFIQIMMIYLCYILFLSPLAETSSNDTSDNATNSASDYSTRYNNTICLDCREENKYCNISDTGYLCKISSTFDSESVGSTTLSDTPISRDLDVCLPEGLDIKGYPGTSLLCRLIL